MTNKSTSDYVRQYILACPGFGIVRKNILSRYFLPFFVYWVYCGCASWRVLEWVEQ